MSERKKDHINLGIEITIEQEGKKVLAETRCRSFRGWGWNHEEAIEDLKRNIKRGI